MNLSTECEFYFQPIFNCDEKVVALEALIRPFQKDITIAEFLNKYNNIPDFDLSVIKTVISYDLPKDIYISINVSIKTFECIENVEYIIYLCTKHKIILEILENSDTQYIESVIMNLKYLKKQSNILIALDDYGGNLSNFNRLSSLNECVDIVKMDKILSQLIDHDFYAYVLLKGKIKFLSSYMNKIIILEGIERDKQLKVLTSLNYKNIFIQGFVYSKAKPLKDIKRDFSEKSSLLSLNPINDAFKAKLNIEYTLFKNILDI